ncbi:MAG: P-type conjugative transfer protein TrbL [Desulfovibrio sp. S3730MH75]|nr:MAG: P-type conjugative transfer protein TrbL [Desulfovibrio sp. S3730MH75]
MQIGKTVLYLSPALAVVMLLFFSTTSHAQEVEILSQIAVQFHSKASQWDELLTEHALVLFRLLLILDVCLLGIKIALKRTEIQDAFAEFIMLILYAGLMLSVVIYYKDWTNQLITGLTGIAQELGAPPVTAGSIFLAGVQIFETLLDSLTVNVAKSLGIIIIAIAICITFSLIAAQVILVKCEAYIILNAGIILLGFSGSKITKDYAINFIKYAFSVSVKLFVMQLLLALSIDFITEFRNTGASFDRVLVVLGASIVILALSMSIPDIISGLINGPLASSGGYLTSSVSAVSTGVMAATQGMRGMAGGAVDAKRGVDAVREASSFADSAGMSRFGKLGHMASTGVNAMRDNLSPTKSSGVRSSVKTQHETFKMGQDSQNSENGDQS